MKRRRRILRGFAIALAILVLAAALLPWWLPAGVSAIAGRWGVQVGAWQSHGWSGVTFRNVSVAQKGWSATVRELTLPVLGVWPRAGGDAATIRADEVTVKLVPNPQQVSWKQGEVSMHEIVSTIMRAWPTLKKHLPPTEVNGFRLEQEAAPVVAAKATWNGDEFKVTDVRYGSFEPISASLEVSSETALALNLRLPSRGASMVASGDLQPESLDIAATADWKGLQVSGNAHFDRDGLLPQDATVTADPFRIDSAAIGLVSYGPVSGGVDLKWHDGSYSGTMTARAEPKDGEGDLPPLSVDVAAVGNVDQLSIESAEVVAPGVRLSLSAPLRWAFADGIPETSTRFDVAINLERLPWIHGKGELTGTADLTRDDSKEASATFALRGGDLAWREYGIKSLDVTGKWTPDLLTVETLDAAINERSSLTASAQVDLRAREVRDGKLDATLDLSAARMFEPAIPEFETATIQASAEGPWTALRHHGSLNLEGLEAARFEQIGARLDWTGTGATKVEFKGEARSSVGVTAPFAIALTHAGGPEWKASFTELSWRDGDGTWWGLDGPALATVTVPTEPNARPSVRFDGIKLAGEEFAMETDGRLRWPAEGQVRVRARGLNAARLAPLIPEAYLNLSVQDFSVDAQWDEGPVKLDGSLRVRYTADDQTWYDAQAGFQTAEDSSGLEADVGVMADSGIVVSGKGAVPLVIEGREAGFKVAVPLDGPVDLKLASEPNAAFWHSIGELTGWTLEGPRISATLSGSLRAPRGFVELSADTIAPPVRPNGAPTLPELSGLSVRATADDEGVSLDEGILAVDGRWVRLTGSAPWSVWRTWSKDKRLAWRDVTFALASNPLPVAIASRIYPTILAPNGEVSLNLQHDPSEGLSGKVWLHGASLRPIAPFGAIREINGELNFKDDAVQLPELSALIGGRPIEISASGRVHPGDRVDFDVHALSTRVPIVREAGLVIRAGIDLHVRRDSEAPARITGSVELGPSVYVSDITSLLPKGSVTTPEQRPPFFSVRDEPFAQWTLDVDLRGERFLRVENPLFRGTLSADFHLGGTLEEPRAIGSVTGFGGSVAFPFANIPLDNLELTLSPENPYEPQILATGATRVFGYDIRMEATGRAADPQLVFSADPPLSSQETFLMLTTGALPSDSQGFSTSERAQKLAFFLGRNLAAGFGIGAPGEDRLTIRSGENFSREGRETLYVQYDLNGRWSVIGEYDRFDAYNGGIKFRLIDR